MSLPPLTGHEKAREIATGAVLRGTLPQALLLSGPPGVGKQRFALWLGQLVLCERPSREGPCSKCSSCLTAASLNHPDIHWHFPLKRPRGATRDQLGRALEQARGEVLAQKRQDPLGDRGRRPEGAIYLAAVRQIREAAGRRPVLGAEHVFVIGDAEAMVPQESSPEAANALLKVLEEPPGPCKFVLTTTQPAGLLPTIRSRTVPLALAPLPLDLVAGFLKDDAGVEPAEAERAAELSRGSIGRGLGFVAVDDEPGAMETLRQDAFRLVGSALAGAVEGEGGSPDESKRRSARAGRSWQSPTDGTPRARLDRVYRIALAYGSTGGRELGVLLSFMEEWIRDLGAVSSGARADVWNRDALVRLETMVERTALSGIATADILGYVQEARLRLRGNVHPPLVIYGLLRAMARRALRAEATN